MDKRPRRGHLGGYGVNFSTQKCLVGVVQKSNVFVMETKS